MITFVLGMATAVIVPAVWRRWNKRKVVQFEKSFEEAQRGGYK
jgi:hypothetical protein